MEHRNFIAVSKLVNFFEQKNKLILEIASHFLTKMCYCTKNAYMLFAGLGSVRIVKNCDRGLENAALSLRPRAQGALTSV